jgi:hypothetical protein
MSLSESALHGCPLEKKPADCPQRAFLMILRSAFLPQRPRTRANCGLFDRVSPRALNLRLGANLCRVCGNQFQKRAKDNRRVRFLPCGNKVDPDIIWLQTIEADTI